MPEKFRLTVFDIFGYTIPGFFYLIIIILSTNYINPLQLINKISVISFNSILFYFWLSYLIGFCFDEISVKFITFFSTVFFGNFNDRILNQFKMSNPNSNDKNILNYNFFHIYSFIDIRATHTREKIDSLSALSNMTRNLSFGSFLFALLTLCSSILNIGKVQWWEVTIKFLIAIFFSYFLILRSNRFRKYSHLHLLNSYLILSKTKKKLDE